MRSIRVRSIPLEHADTSAFNLTPFFWSLSSSFPSLFRRVAVSTSSDRGVPGRTGNEPLHISTLVRTFKLGYCLLPGSFRMLHPSGLQLSVLPTDRASYRRCKQSHSTPLLPGFLSGDWVIKKSRESTRLDVQFHFAGIPDLLGRPLSGERSTLKLPTAFWSADSNQSTLPPPARNSGLHPALGLKQTSTQGVVSN